ncbi:MAG: hypothetical protein Q7S19_03025 [bacterium]|nr:hypothetical protein [bacterium]
MTLDHALADTDLRDDLLDGLSKIDGMVFTRPSMLPGMQMTRLPAQMMRFFMGCPPLYDSRLFEQC